MRNIGFIGAGNMASAIIGGIVKSKLLQPENIIASALRDSTLERVNKEFGIKVTKDSQQVVKESDIIFVSVKPNVYDEVLNQVKEFITNDKIIIAIAAGKTIE